MWTNEEAFERLASALSHKSRSYSRSEIVRNPMGNPQETVAVGLDRTAMTTLAVDQRVTLTGRLSVRALMAKEGVRNPFEIAGVRGRNSAAKWLVRSRLSFDITNSRLQIPTGLHIAEAVYILSEDDPAAIDKHFANAADPDEDVEILSAQYRHEPTDIFRTDVLERRAELIRRWVKEPKHAAGMSMISPTELGGIDVAEIPLTIDWLLAAPQA